MPVEFNNVYKIGTTGSFNILECVCQSTLNCRNLLSECGGQALDLLCSSVHVFISTHFLATAF